MVACVIRDTPADLITLKPGINVYGEGYELIGSRVAERVLPEVLALRV